VQGGPPEGAMEVFIDLLVHTNVSNHRCSSP
jgi:hypothetical protein